MKLSDLLLNYRTDKNIGAVEKGKGHLYGRAYDEIFSWFDCTSRLNILEIGVHKGGSLRAWKDFCPNSTVTGVDIVDVREKEYISDDIRFVLSDIKDVDVEKDIGTAGFDVIIDDGSHQIEDVFFVVRNYLGRLNIDGVMVIEDVQVPIKWMALVLWDIINYKNGCFKLQYRDMRKAGLYDDFLIVIKRKNNSTFNKAMFFVRNLLVGLFLTMIDLNKREERKRIIGKIKRLARKSEC